MNPETYPNILNFLFFSTFSKKKGEKKKTGLYISLRLRIHKEIA